MLFFFCFIVGIYWIVESKDFKHSNIVPHDMLCHIMLAIIGKLLIQCNGHYSSVDWVLVPRLSAVDCWVSSVTPEPEPEPATGFRPHWTHFVPADTRQNCSHFWYCCCVTQLENKKDKNCFFCLKAEGRWNEIIRVHWRSSKFSTRY